MIATSLYND